MILFILETDRERIHFFKAGFVYLVITIFCALFGAIYEHFSHEVYSYYMIYAFAYPLIMGVLPFMMIYKCEKIRVPGRISENLYNAGVGTLTVGSIIKGVLIIYGTTNALSKIYFIVGIGMVVLGITAYLLQCIGRAKK